MKEEKENKRKEKKKSFVHLGDLTSSTLNWNQLMHDSISLPAL